MKKHIDILSYRSHVADNLELFDTKSNRKTLLKQAEKIIVKNLSEYITNNVQTYLNNKQYVDLKNKPIQAGLNTILQNGIDFIYEITFTNEHINVYDKTALLNELDMQDFDRIYVMSSNELYQILSIA